MNQGGFAVRDAVVAEIEAARAEIVALVDSLTREQLLAPNAAGIWSVKDALAHLTEWARWNFAQIRSALEDQAPRLDGRRPVYPPHFDQVMPADERNRLIYEASQARSLEDVRADFEAVTSGFVDWLRTCSDADMNAILGLDVHAADEPPATARFIKRVGQGAALVNQMPLTQMLFDPDPDVGSITHWLHHLRDVQAYAERLR